MKFSVCYSGFDKEGRDGVLNCHGVSRVVIPLNDGDAVGNFIVDLFATAVHNLRHARCGHVHQFLPQDLVVDVQHDRNLFLQKLEHDPTLVAKAEE